MTDARGPIARGNDVPWDEFGRGPKLGSRHRRLARAAGGRKLGCSLYEVEPGRRAFPFHLHHAAEEAIYVLAGRGTLRVGAQSYDVGPGDYAAFPPGPDHAHQLINTGGETLRYLCLSTNEDPDICEYPDSGKIAAFAGRSVSQDRPPALRKVFWGKDGQVGYFDGEDTGE